MEQHTIQPENELTLDSVQRSKKVLEIMTGMKHPSPDDVTFFKGLPSLLKQNGLGQTMAFLYSKEKKDVLKILNPLLFPNIKDEAVEIMRKIQSIPVDEYLQKQSDAIDYAGWIKMFAIAMVKPVSNDGGKDAAAS